MMSFDRFLNDYQNDFLKNIEPHVKQWLLRCGEQFDEEASLTLEMVKRCGTRFRSGVYRYSVGASSERFEVDAMLELFHVALVIHDDVVDHVPKRWGTDAFHTKLGDEDRAVIWGDWLLAMLHDVFYRACGLKGSLLFSGVYEATCQGQLLGLSFRQNDQVSESDFLSSYGLKTGMNNFYLPLALACHQREVEWNEDALKSVSLSAGILLQLTDDLAFFDEGKTFDSGNVRFDRKQLTYPLWLIHQRTGKRVFETTDQCFSDWFREVKASFKKMGGVAEITSRVRALCAQLSASTIGFSVPEMTQRVGEIFGFVKKHVFSKLEQLDWDIGSS